MAETASEFVYIIGHVPPGYQGAMMTWSREFNKIIARYATKVLTKSIFYSKSIH